MGADFLLPLSESWDFQSGGLSCLSSSLVQWFFLIGELKKKWQPKLDAEERHDLISKEGWLPSAPQSFIQLIFDVMFPSHQESMCQSLQMTDIFWVVISSYHCKYMKLIIIKKCIKYANMVQKVKAKFRRLLPESIPGAICYENKARCCCVWESHMEQFVENISEDFQSLDTTIFCWKLAASNDF